MFDSWADFDGHDLTLIRLDDDVNLLPSTFGSRVERLAIVGLRVGTYAERDQGLEEGTEEGAITDNCDGTSLNGREGASRRTKQPGGEGRIGKKRLYWLRVGDQAGSGSTIRSM